MFLLPFVIPLSKALATKCARCGTTLELKQPVSWLSLKDEVMTFKCGECAVVISRSYLLTAVIIISCVFLYIWSTPEHTGHSHEHIYSQATWPEYIKDCGGEVVLKNSIRATEMFSRKYEGKTITWDGYLMRATENYGWFRGEHAAIVLVKMSPSESDIHADLILSLDDNDLVANTQALASLDKGDKFEFNATFVSPGNEHQLHHLHAHYIEKRDGHMEIPAHIHTVNHRYNLNPQTSQNTQVSVVS